MDFTGKLTPQGETLLAKVLAHGIPLTVTRVVAGSGTTGEGELSLASPRQDAPISQRTTDGSLSTIMVTLAANLAQQTYSLTELGVYATDPELGEILYQIFTLNAPLEIVPGSRLVLRTYLRLCVSDELDVALSLPPSGLLVEADVTNKADLVDGQVPYVQTPHLTANRTLYVDAASGDDNNPGTEALPFRTIQAAVNALPKDLNIFAGTISLKPGIYNEVVKISGFHGGPGTILNPGLQIVGASTLDNASDYVVAGLFFTENSASCLIRGLLLTAQYFPGNYSGVACVSRSNVKFMNTQWKFAEGFTASPFAIAALWDSAVVCVDSCQIDGVSCGACVACGSILDIVKTNISNCNVGLRAGYGSCGIILADTSVTFSENDTDYTKICAGSRIFGLEE